MEAHGDLDCGQFDVRSIIFPSLSAINQRGMLLTDTTQLMSGGDAMDRVFPRLLAFSLATMLVLAACASSSPSSSTGPITAAATATPAVEQAQSPATVSTPKAESSELTVQWIRQQFGDAWDIEYPQGWTINDAGVYAGSLSAAGTYNAQRYVVSFDVPILPPGISPSGDIAMLDACASEIAALPQEQQKAVAVEETVVAGVPARRVLNMPDPATGEVTHRLYIWRSGSVNPRLIVIRPIDQETPDRKEMQELLDRFGAGVR